MKNYLEVNKTLWDKRTDIHVDSDFYDNESFITGRNSLNQIELDLLGDVTGKSILHLQCHFGQDTISLGRMGAKVTGVDLSPKSIEAAQSLAKKTGSDAQFVCADVLGLPHVLEGSFDMVFTSYGTIGWLPDLNQWAQVIQHFLKPGGQLVFAEFHPIVWMFDDDFDFVKYTYHKSEPIVEQLEETYADRSSHMQEKSISWNHGLAEVFQALKKSGMHVIDFKEYNYSPYSFVKDMDEYEPGKFRIRKFGDRIPLVYSLLASKGI